MAPDTIYVISRLTCIQKALVCVSSGLGFDSLLPASSTDTPKEEERPELVKKVYKWNTKEEAKQAFKELLKEKVRFLNNLQCQVDCPRLVFPELRCVLKHTTSFKNGLSQPDRDCICPLVSLALFLLCSAVFPCTFDRKSSWGSSL